jgi:clan AA aspartic protease (TIGR02281 family)
MTRTAAVLSAGVGLVLAATAASSRAQDEGSDSVLKGKGLKKSGSSYVLAAEADVQKGINQARRLYQSVSEAASQKGSFEAERDAVKAEIEAMDQQRAALGEQLDLAADVTQHNRIATAMNSLGAQIRTLENRLAEAEKETPARLAQRLTGQREAFVEAVLALRQQVDKVAAAYKELAADPAVKQAFERLNESGKGKAKVSLGPSRGFASNVKLLERVEASILTERIPLRNDTGVYEVDVVFNGKVTKPLCFDTGAALISLPAELAAEIGVNPGPDAPTLIMEIADGSRYNAKKAVIPSVRVGKFVLKDVECVVNPPEKKNVPALLGQSFIRHFEYKIDNVTKTLVLSKVETAGTPGSSQAPKAKARAKTKGRTPRGKRAAKSASPPPE